jgi:hypothetical protein
MVNPQIACSATKILPVSRLTGRPLPRNADFTYPEETGEQLRAAFTTVETLLNEYNGLTWGHVCYYNGDVFDALKGRQAKVEKAGRLPPHLRVISRNFVMAEGLEALKTNDIRNGVSRGEDLAMLLRQASLLNKSYGEIKETDAKLSKRICRKYYENKTRFPEGHSLHLVTIIDDTFLTLLQKPAKPLAAKNPSLRSGLRTRLRSAALQRFAEAETFAQYRQDHPQATQLRYVQAVLARSNLRADDDVQTAQSRQVILPMNRFVPLGAITAGDFDKLNEKDERWVRLTRGTLEQLSQFGRAVLPEDRPAQTTVATQATTNPFTMIAKARANHIAGMGLS